MALSYDVTIKQVLVKHIGEHHRRIQARGRSFAELSKMHSKDHFKLPLDHDHEGQLGLKTGQGVLSKKGA